jgi:hypothetical protein
MGLDVVVKRDDDLTVCGTDTRVSGRSRALIALSETLEREWCAHLAQELPGLVCRPVVDNDHFEVIRAQILLGECFEKALQTSGAIVSSDDN